MPPCSDVEMPVAAKYSPDSSSKDPTTERERSRKKWTGPDSEGINITITFTHQDDRVVFYNTISNGASIVLDALTDIINAMWMVLNQSGELDMLFPDL